MITISPDIKLPSPFGDEALTEAHQKRFLKHFKNSPGVVLEIGCGRGVMLDLFKKAGIPSYGIDSSEVAVTLCTGKGLNVIHTTVLSHLKEMAPMSLGGIFCAHVIEHMNPDEVIRLFDESSRVLKPNGTLIIITPNPRDLRTTERFWLDITHVRPYPEKLLTALLNEKGFSEILVEEDKEPAKNPIERVAKWFLRLWFMGFMFRGDLVLIAKR